MDESHVRPTETTGLSRKVEEEHKVHIPESASVCPFSYLRQTVILSIDVLLTFIFCRPDLVFENYGRLRDQDFWWVSPTLIQAI